MNPRCSFLSHERHDQVDKGDQHHGNESYGTNGLVVDIQNALKEAESHAKVLGQLQSEARKGVQPNPDGSEECRVEEDPNRRQSKFTDSER